MSFGIYPADQATVKGGSMGQHELCEEQSSAPGRFRGYRFGRSIVDQCADFIGMPFDEMKSQSDSGECLRQLVNEFRKRPILDTRNFLLPRS